MSPLPLQGSKSDLSQFGINELEGLAEDLRQRILSVCLTNGGHLGASLGTVELSIALHRTFDSPRDLILWDTGHQAYAHKLLTGRWDSFKTLRQKGGVSGFPARDESIHDPFGTGHSSTTLSAGLAMAWAKKQKKAESENWTISVVGDGGLTAGIAHEALEQVRSLDLSPYLLVINDNQMSISPNVGAISQILTEGSARPYFELLGFEWVGPIDGHDLNALIGTLNGIRTAKPNKPVALHVLTQKGKGYLPAEESPAQYHGVSPIAGKADPLVPTVKKGNPSWSAVFGKSLCELAEADPRIVAITAAMPEGTGLTAFAQKFPQRFFDVGIAEAHAVTFAAGLATQGYRPVVALYSTFLQRALDGVIHDVALQNLPVIFAVDRAGIVGQDGPTHHGAFDLTFLGMIPNLTLHAPTFNTDLSLALKSSLQKEGPSAIRFPRGEAALASAFDQKKNSESTQGFQVLKATDDPLWIVVGVGPLSLQAFQSIEALGEAGGAFSCVALTQVKPFPVYFLQWLNQYPNARVICLEEGSERGGVGQALLAEMPPEQRRDFKLRGYPDHFIPHGKAEELHDELGLSVRGLKDWFLKLSTPS